MNNRSLEFSELPTWKKALYAAAFICLMLAGFLLVFTLRSKSEENYGSPLGNVTPQIQIGDTVYYWWGSSQKHTGADTPGRQVTTPDDGSTFLPEGFSQYGSLTAVTTSPAKDLEFQADFPASGTVYCNPDAPEVVYILMTTDWFENSYIRFASRNIFDGDRIAWNGKQYCSQFRKGTSSPLEELPKDAVSIGTLHFIGIDYIPKNDLETNCISDDHAMSLEGREVFADPNDSDYIYVYKSHLGSSGGYWKCPIWERSYLLQYVK